MKNAFNTLSIFFSIVKCSDFSFGKLAFNLRQEITDTCNEFTDWNKKTFKETQNGTSEGKMMANILLYQFFFVSLKNLIDFL
jgi:hypothetical protein